MPALSLRPEELAGVLALLGTTLTSYVYIWETIQRSAERPAGNSLRRRLGRSRIGAVSGAIFTAVTLWAMLAASAATLGREHAGVTSAQGAALSLRPLAGHLAADLFAVGLVVSALVALPVLVAGTAYIVGAQFDWSRGLSAPVSGARRFYAVIAAAILIAIAVSLIRIPIFGLLVAASIVGGLATPAGLVALLRVASNPAVMRGRPISRALAGAGWVVTAVVTALGALFAIGSLSGTF